MKWFDQSARTRTMEFKRRKENEKKGVRKAEFRESWHQRWDDEGEKGMCRGGADGSQRGEGASSGTQQVGRSRTGWPARIDSSEKEKEKERGDDSRWLRSRVRGKGEWNGTQESILKRLLFERIAAIIFHLARTRHRLFLTFWGWRAPASSLTVLEISRPRVSPSDSARRRGRSRHGDRQ